MSWFEKLMPSRIRVDANKDKKVIPELNNAFHVPDTL